MEAAVNFEPELCAYDDIPRIRESCPLWVADKDGTLTIRKGLDKPVLTMETFVRSVDDLGDPLVRNELLQHFDQYHAGILKISYEDYLRLLGYKWAKMLYFAKLTRGKVIERAGKWFEDEGINEIQHYAGPFMKELDQFLFSTVLLTGAPAEIAYHFARHLRIKRVFGMMAETAGEDQHYSSPYMPDRHNTGLRDTKSDTNRGLGRKLSLGGGMGDTFSDAGIALPVMTRNKENPEDLTGVFVLINGSADTTEKYRTAYRDFYRNEQIVEIDGSNPNIEPLLARFRYAIERVFTLNDKTYLFQELKGYERMDEEKRKTNGERLKRQESAWA